MIASRKSSSGPFTEAEYLALEAVAESKHEFFEGEIISMAGASPAHNQLSARMIALLDAMARKEGCVVFSSDQRVHISATGAYAYPDVTVACSDRKFKADKPPSLVNPTIIVEVTSETSEGRDTGSKFRAYRKIPSLREYILVSQTERLVECYRRVDHEWVLASTPPGEPRIEIRSLGGFIALADLYDGVELTQVE